MPVVCARAHCADACPHLPLWFECTVGLLSSVTPPSALVEECLIEEHPTGQQGAAPAVDAWGDGGGQTAGQEGCDCVLLWAAQWLIGRGCQGQPVMLYHLSRSLSLSLSTTHTHALTKYYRFAESDD